MYNLFSLFISAEIYCESKFYVTVFETMSGFVFNANIFNFA